MKLKVTKKQKTKLYTLFIQHIFFNISLGLRHGFFLDGTSMLVFAELATFHYI